MQSRTEPTQSPESKPEYDVAIMGAGFAGIGMAHKLREAGIERIVILERADSTGGTWRDNHYPGCACDIPSHLYSYSFRQNADWTRLYPQQAEIADYLDDCVAAFGVAELIRCNSNVSSATFDERSGHWRVELDGGDSLSARALVSAVGGLSRPSLPEIEGLASFEGQVFHTADWDESCDLSGKRVAVVGTGASAIQLVPKVAEIASQLSVFQRTAPWVVPKFDRPMRGWEQWLMRKLPFTQRLFRAFLYWRQEILGVGFTLSAKLMAYGRYQARRHIRNSIADPELREAVTPDYEIGCKRVLLSDDYYPSLERDNVELVNHAVTRFTGTGVVDATGRERAVDVAIFATGFNAVDPLSPTRIFGRGGRELAEDWRDGPEAHLGINVAGFPNFFILMGPNTGLGHNSVIFMIEAQVRYSVRLIRELLSDGGRDIDVRPEVQEQFNTGLQSAFAGSVWSSGCKSWYQTDSGRQFAIWPGFTFTYWFRTLRPRLKDFDRPARLQ